MPTNESYTTTWAERGTTLDTIIDEFLGAGLDEAQWRTAIERRRWTWNNSVRNRIIHKEFVYFLPEIMQLLTESNAARGMNSNESNSRATYASVFRRIRGETWAEGVSDEANERKRTRRLYGKVSHLRSFQNRISKSLQYLEETCSESQKSESMMEEESIAQMNTPAPVGLLTAAPGQTSASPTAADNRFGFGVLDPTGLPPSFRNTSTHNSAYAPGNNGTSPGIGNGKSSSMNSSMDIINEGSAHPQMTVTSSSFSSIREGNQLSVDSTYLRPGTIPFQESSGAPTQQNEPVLRTEFDHFFDHKAYYADNVAFTGDIAGASLDDDEMQDEPMEISDFPQKTAVNHLLPPRPPEFGMSSNSENRVEAAEKLSFGYQLVDPTLDNIHSKSFDGNAHSVSTSSNRQSTFPPAHNDSHEVHTENDEPMIHQSIKSTSYPRSDTDMESVSTIRSRTTRKVPVVGRKENEKRAILRRIVLRQREKLKVRNAENAEMRDIIKAVHALQVSHKRTSEVVELLLQLAIDDKQGHSRPGNSTSPKRVLPSRTAPAGASHSRQKSTVSSSAGTTTTSSSVTVNSKELKKRTGDLEGRIKAMASKLRTMKDIRDLNHDARHDSGIVNPDEVHDLKLVNQEVKHDSGVDMGISEDGRRPESINRNLRLSLRDKIFDVAGLAEYEPNDE